MSTATGGLWPVSRALAWRSLRLIPRIPSAFVPTLVMPVFFVVAFSGAFSAIVNIPGFPTDSILDWFVPFAAVQGAAFSGVGIGFGALRDLESGFTDRLLTAPTPRFALLLGLLMAAMMRSVFPMVAVLVVGGIGGLAVPGGALALVCLAVAGFGAALVSASYALGLAFRIQSQQAAPLIQFGIFLTIFLSTAQVPLTVMTGWLKAVASVNPVTQVLRLARAGFVDTVVWWEVWPGLLALAGLIAVSVWFAARGLRHLVP